MEENEMHELLPAIDTDICIECGKCQKICPILNPAEFHVPFEVFAARSNDKNDAFSGASGGIATTLYKEGLKEEFYIAGAIQNEDFSVCLDVGNNKELIERFKNSKYVFSSAYSLYPRLAALLKQGIKVIVVGLPCQIAAIRKLFGDNSNLLLIDLVCHGTTPLAYLQQHIQAIEKDMGQTAVKMYFRDPYAYTYTYTFTLYNNLGERFYAKRTKEGEAYQYGYHRAITYRENCYHCPFACNKRVGDLSLADYPGLGRITPFPYDSKFINCVLVNTPKGKDCIRNLVNKKVITAYQRPIEEPIKYNRQLRTHVEKSVLRLEFERVMKANGSDFERAITPLMNKGLRKEKINQLLHFPLSLAGKVKGTIKNLIK